MDDELDTKIKELAQKGLDSQDPQLGWLWRTLSLLVFFALLWYTKRQLAQKEQELAEAKAALEKQKLDNEWQAMKAELDQLEEQAAQLVAQAAARIADALSKQQAAEQHFIDQQTAVTAIGNWDDLNKYAGV